MQELHVDFSSILPKHVLTELPDFSCTLVKKTDRKYFMIKLNQAP